MCFRRISNSFIKIVLCNMITPVDPDVITLFFFSYIGICYNFSAILGSSNAIAFFNYFLRDLKISAAKCNFFKEVTASGQHCIIFLGLRD